MRRSYAIDFHSILFSSKKISRAELHYENRKEQLCSVRPSMKHVAIHRCARVAYGVRGGRGEGPFFKVQGQTYAPPSPCPLTLVWKQQQQQHKCGAGKKKGRGGEATDRTPPSLVFFFVPVIAYAVRLYALQQYAIAGDMRGSSLTQINVRG